MTAENRELAGQGCAVTGAGSGIGRAAALALARAGARVAIIDRNRPNAQATLEAVRAAGGEGIAIGCDVADEESVAAAAGEAGAALGPIDILVNNAGILSPGPLATLTLAEWNALLSVNLTGYFLCSRIFGGGMRERGRGSIVHVASIAGAHPTANAGAYSVAKAGVVMLSRQLAVEWGGSGVRSNVVSPGIVATPMTEPFHAQPGVIERRNAVIPAARIGRPGDIAEAILFLAGPRSAYVSGDEITVDGGFSRTLMGFVPRPGYE